MLDYRIISVDLDGTLLDNDMHISAENNAAIGELAARGVLFVPNSGRTLYEIPAEVRENPYVRYIIHSDGAAIFDKKTGNSFTACMPRTLAGRMLNILYRFPCSLSVRYRGRSYVKAEEHNEEGYIRYRVNPLYRQFLYETNQPIEHFEDFCRNMEEIEMICAFFTNDTDENACRTALLATGEVHVASSAPHNIEFFDNAAGKGNALLRLARELGIDERATIAVGDSTNDSDMIKKAGLGLAMANACPALTADADAVVCHNTEHVVKYILEHYIRS